MVWVGELVGAGFWPGHGWTRRLCSGTCTCGGAWLDTSAVLGHLHMWRGMVGTRRLCSGTCTCGGA
eukprot:355203-Chlamydomonas_euryale.AAC.1